MLALVALAVVVLAAVLANRRPTGQAPGGAPPPHHAAEPLTPLRLTGRVVGVGLLALAIVAGRIGNPRELSNIAPALVIGVAWPALLVGSLLLGRVWAVLDPWDGLARALRAPAGVASGRAPTGGELTGGEDTGEPAVWPAAVVASLWTWYLAVPASALSPRSVGLALVVYTLAMVAGCLVAGRAAWLARAELFGLLSGWIALLRDGRWRAWMPPPGAPAVLGVLAGGLLFAELRRTAAWGPLAVHPLASLWNGGGLVVSALGVAGLAVAAERAAARHGARGAAAVGLIPLAAGVGVAAALARDRLLVAVQVVLVRASDPLGRGWDLLGTAYWPLRPSPLGHTGRDLAQYLIVLVAGAAAAWVGTRRAGRLVGSVLLLHAGLTGAAVWVLLGG